MQPLPSHLVEMIEGVVTKTRNEVEAGKPPSGLAYLLNSVSREIVELPIDVDSEPAKDVSVAHIRKVALMMDADAVIVVLNSWGLPANKVKDVFAIKEKYGSIGRSPYRVSQMGFTIETADCVWLGAATLTKHPKKLRRETFGELKFISAKPEEATGTFTNLLSRVPRTVH